MPLDPDRREAEARDDRAGEPRDPDGVPDGAPAGDPEPDRSQGELFPWEEREPVGEAAATPELAEPAEAEDTPERADVAGRRPGRALMSREKVVWEWPYPGDWIEEGLT